MKLKLFDRQASQLQSFPREDNEIPIGLDREKYYVLKVINLPLPSLQPDEYALPAEPVIEIINPDEEINGQVTFGWEIRTTSDQFSNPDVLGFFSELSRNPDIAEPIGDLLSDMMQPRPNRNHAPQTALGLSVGLWPLADRGDPRVFLDAWSQALERGLLNSELIAKVQQVAREYGLPREFVSALQPGATPPGA